MPRRKSVLIAGLVVLNVFSALYIVYTTHMNRKLHVALQGQLAMRDQLNMEWGQLQLEQSTYATHNKIEQAARMQLGMHLPKLNEVERIRQ